MFAESDPLHHRRAFVKYGLLSGAGSLLHTSPAQAAATQPKTAVILFWMAGGPSHIDTYDMKPHAPAEIRGPFQPIPTTVPGLDFCELMPRQAAIADRLTVIRSLHHTYSVHDDGQHLVQTGVPQFNARQAGQQHPCQGSVAAYVRGPIHPQMPAYVCIPEDYRSHMGFYQHAAFLGSKYHAVNGGGDPTLGKYRQPEFALPAEVDARRLAARRSLNAQLENHARGVDPRPTLSLDDSRTQAYDLLLGSAARQAFDIATEPAALRDQYGRHAWGQAALLSRRLVEAGVTFVTINLYEKDVDWWDDHYTIEKNLRARLPVYDQALAALVREQHDRGLNERVLVVACGEFGRSPRIDQQAGRGHWPGAMHAVLAGGGLRMGQVIGSTTTDGGAPADRPLTPGDLLASIYRVLHIDPHTMLHDRLNRPIPVLPPAEPIRELFG